MIDKTYGDSERRGSDQDSQTDMRTRQKFEPAQLAQSWHDALESVETAKKRGSDQTQQGHNCSPANASVDLPTQALTSKSQQVTLEILLGMIHFMDHGVNLMRLQVGTNLTCSLLAKLHRNENRVRSELPLRGQTLRLGPKVKVDGGLQLFKPFRVQAAVLE